jgi:hypothetical protein
VDYGDLLELTLPYNRHHFDEFMVVTTHEDRKTQEVAKACGAYVYMTESFYANGATFNKWLSLEEGLDVFGREGWMVLIDPDVRWPKDIDYEYRKGFLYSPLCYIQADMKKPVPDESDWIKLPLRGNQAEWAGYTQIFHATDPVLGPPPWHEVDWKHAGGADSFFQRKWPRGVKVRPPWRSLHIGPPGRNWCGRVTPYTDGTVDPKSRERAQTLRDFLVTRHRRRNYDHEKLR